MTASQAQPQTLGTIYGVEFAILETKAPWESPVDVMVLSVGQSYGNLARAVRDQLSADWPIDVSTIRPRSPRQLALSSESSGSSPRWAVLATLHSSPVEAPTTTSALAEVPVAVPAALSLAARLAPEGSVLLPILGAGALGLETAVAGRAVVDAAVSFAEGGSKVPLRSIVFLAKDSTDTDVLQSAWSAGPRTRRTSAQSADQPISPGPAGMHAPPPSETPDAPSSAEPDSAASQERTELTGGVAADLVNPDRGIPRSEDDLGVSTYVGMMASAIARRDTKLPLSIGLFGEWGSGKSYFMGLLRSQVDSLSTSGDPAYSPAIIQTGFNAWSYADANLWASLGDEIFRSLAKAPDDVENEEAADRQRREQLVKWLTDGQGRIQELEAAKQAATDEVAKLQAALEKSRSKRDVSAIDLLKATTTAVQEDPGIREDLSQIWKKVGVSEQAEQAQILVDAVRGGSKDLASLRRTARSGTKYVLIATLVVGLVGLGLAIAGTLSGWWALPSVAVVVSAAAVLATVVGHVSSGLRSIAGIADSIRRGVEAGKKTEVEEALKKVDAADARRQVLQAQLDEVLARVGQLGRELIEMTPGQRLYTFLAERAGSDDYRRHLGLIATIRRDFTELAKLQDRWRRDPSGDSPRPIDRIVLYIDDLDRCTPRQVVDVLQAVHLLLALDLFVVVVGVDPRWLLHSLRDQYSSLLSATSVEASPSAEWSQESIDDGTRLMLGTPQDYLEKIFNVPFVLPGMSKTGFDAMIRRLSEPEAENLDDVTPDAERTGTDDGDAAGADPAAEGTSDISSSEPNLPIDAKSEIAASLQGEVVVRKSLQESELALLSSMAPLIRTPREAKRLLNLYRMLRSTQDLSDASRFLGDDTGQGEYQAVALLLGLLAADPRLLGKILFAPVDATRGMLGGACVREGDISWPDFVQGLVPRFADGTRRNDIATDFDESESEAWQALVTAISPATSLVQLAGLAPFRFWGPHVARFSFLLVPADRLAEREEDDRPVTPAAAA